MTRQSNQQRHTQQYVMGKHTVLTLLEHRIEQIKELWLAHQIKLTEQQSQRLRHAGLTVQRVENSWLDRKLNSNQHQGWAALIAKNSLIQNELALTPLVAARGQQLLLLVLDEVQDPHNLGACWRSASALGADALIIPCHQACPVTPTVTKAASGAVASTPLIIVNNLVRCLRAIKQQGVWIYGADDQGSIELAQLQRIGPTALVYGSEGQGIRRLVQEECDQLFRIPMHGPVPCLNVSVAVGIGLYALRQSAVKIT